MEPITESVVVTLRGSVAFILKWRRKDQRVNLKHIIALALILVSYKWVEWLISDHMTILNAEPTSESTSEFTSELVIKSTFDNRWVGREWLKIY